MKKILFVLGIIFSVYSFAEQGLSISETDTYQELSKRIELKKEKPHMYSYKTNPYSVFGIRIDDQHFLGKRTIGFDKDSKVCFISVIMGGKRGYDVLTEKMKGFAAFEERSDAVSLSASFEEGDKFGAVMYNKIKDSFIMIVKSKRKECEGVNFTF